MGPPRQTMRDVDLVETDGVPASVARVRQSRWWWPAIAGVVLAVGGGGAITDQRSAARLARLAEVPGLLAPIHGPVSTLWRGDFSRMSHVGAYAGRLLVVQDGPDGNGDVLALEPQTGAAVWRTAIQLPGIVEHGTTCALPDQPVTVDRPPVSRVVACVVVDDSVRAVASDREVSIAGAVRGGSPAETIPTEVRLVVIDATTGAVVTDEPVDPSTSVSTYGADLLLSRVDADGRIRVTRTDRSGTAERWTFRGPDPAGPAGEGRTTVRAHRAGGRVVVTEIDGTGQATRWVLSGAGEVLHASTGGPAGAQPGRIEVLPGGGLVTETSAADDGGQVTAVVDLVTGGSFSAAGEPAAAQPDDRSVRDLVLLRSAPAAVSAGGLAAFDSTGERRWTAPGDADERVALLDGRIIAISTRELRSIDGRTGAVAWSTPLRDAAPSSLVTDGRTVVLTRPGPGARHVVAGYDVRDGHERWSVEVAQDLELTSIGGRLYGWSDRGLVALG